MGRGAGTIGRLMRLPAKMRLSAAQRGCAAFTCYFTPSKTLRKLDSVVDCFNIVHKGVEMRRRGHVFGARGLLLAVLTPLLARSAVSQALAAGTCGRIAFCNSCAFQRQGTVTRVLCLACASGYTPTGDQRACACSAGYFWDAYQALCQPCGLGAWCVHTGMVRGRAPADPSRPGCRISPAAAGAD